MSRFTLASKHYASHKMRDMAQFNIIYNINNDWLKGYIYSILIVLNNNHNVVENIFYKGKEEYFGKMA